MTYVSVSIKLPEEALEAIEKIAQAEDITVGQFLRLAMTNELKKRRGAADSVDADPDFLEPIIELLGPAFAEATGWNGLQLRLRSFGYEVAERAGELVLLHSQKGAARCTIADIGYPYRVLLQKFKAPFPGHSHAWLARRAIDEPAVAHLA